MFPWFDLQDKRQCPTLRLPNFQIHGEFGNLEHFSRETDIMETHTFDGTRLDFSRSDLPND
jgi:hypothetical protein